MTNIKPLFLAVVFVILSLVFGSQIRGSVVEFSGFVINKYYETTTFIKNTMNEHFRQAEEIKILREQNKELEKSAALLSTFAWELNQILIDKNSSKFAPDVRLVKILSYAQTSDYNKFWVEFPEFKQDKVYGLISEGNTAGILLNKDNKPLAILQRDEKSAFSVFVGENKIPGLANGNSNGISVKFIPQWLEPKVGDEVFTSGLDGVFFAGVPVGKVKEIKDEQLYKSAVVEPYAGQSMPTFLYVVTKDK
ncbi:MAG: rod shape-determining protein MreC [Campylobacter sp.]|nr:rod shape-determining protein MreC [Campylobacter sp.]